MTSRKKSIVAVDFDNTLVEWINEDECGAKAGARDALRSLKARGCEIVIHTCRIGIARSSGTLDREIEFIEDVLDRLDLPYDSIHLGSKAVADVYIDDRAVSFRGDWQAAVVDTMTLLSK